MVIKNITNLHKLCENQDISAFLMYFIVFNLMYLLFLLFVFLFFLEEYISEVYEIN